MHTILFHSKRLLLRKSPFSLGLVLLTLAPLTACAPEEVKQYRVAKVSAAPAMALSDASTDEGLTYTAPADWQKMPAGGMRKLSFSLKGGGDFSLVTLPGNAGDLKGNLNRWRGQVGLPPLEDPAEIAKSVRAFKVSDSEGIALELYAPEGQPDKAMRVVLVEKEGANWFFKLAGPRELVKAQAKTFETFMASVKIKPGASAQMPALPEGQAMPGQPPAAPNSAPNANPNADPNSDMNAPGLPKMEPQATNTKLTYTLPATWKEKPVGNIRVASFEVKQGEAIGDVSIVSLAGDGGGLLNNTNRWRKQLEMVPTDQAGLKNAVKDIQIAGHKGYFMALYSGMEGQGMLIAMVEQGGQTWFIKMVAPAKLIQSQESDFLTFVKSIAFHDTSPNQRQAT
jgi:hypothetical protein